MDKYVTGSKFIDLSQSAFESFQFVVVNEMSCNVQA